MGTYAQSTRERQSLLYCSLKCGEIMAHFFCGLITTYLIAIFSYILINLYVAWDKKASLLCPFHRARKIKNLIKTGVKQ